MPVDVHVQDFQSIKDASIRIEGFTVVTGSNNTGKTAMVRAIKGVFQNLPGDAFVRHGTKQSTVTLKFDGGPEVKWEKGKGVNKYTVNGKEYDKVSRGAPEEVGELGVRAIPVGGQTLWPQIASQFTGQVFLLDHSGAVVAEAVADVERVGLLNQALRLSEKDRRSAASTLKVRRGDLLELEEEFQRYAGLDDVVALLEQIEEEQKVLDKLAKMEVWLQSQKSRYTTTKALVERLSGAEAITLPDVEGLQPALDKLHELEALQSRVSTIEREIERLEGIEGVSVEVEIDDFSADLKKLSHLEELRYKGARLQKARKLIKEEITRVWGVYSKAHDEVEELLGELKECPVCGAFTETEGEE